jgi:hypothetical protein
LPRRQNAIVGLSPDYRPVWPDEILHFDCRAKSARFTIEDVLLGRTQVFLHELTDV